MPQVCWENGPKGDLMNIPFDRDPFVLLSMQDQQCHQRKDKNVCKQKQIQRKSMPDIMLRPTSAKIVSKKLSQPTKTLDCHVRGQVENI